MKKVLYIALAIALSVMTATSCSQDLLDIQQKGAVSMEEFYQTDDDATAAIAAVYNQVMGFFYDYKFMTNLPSDDVYAGGGQRGDNIQWSYINEFAISSSNLPSGYYRTPYAIIYRCNLIIDKFDPAESSTKARAVAEARFWRAWSHMLLTIYFGNPPKIDYVMDGSERPENTPASELWPWIISEFDAAASVLPSKANKDDKAGGIRVTREVALAFEGKAQLYNNDYSGAKTNLKKVIDSGKYDLVPGSEYMNIWRLAGDLSVEKMLEINVTPNGTNTYPNSMLYLMWGWRADHVTAMPKILYNNSWGFLNPTKEYYDALKAHDGENSIRFKETIKTYDDVVAMDFGTTPDGKPVEFHVNTPLFGHEGYFDMKYAFYDEGAVKARNGYAYANNSILMRYAEVLLMYAEACAQTSDDGSGLAALNKVQARVGAPLTSLTLQNVKDEKRFELSFENERFADLVRWGDAAKVYAGKTRQKIPTCAEGWVVEWHDYYSGAVRQKDYDFTPGKSEHYPYPLSELNVNPNIVQNPGY